MTVFHIHDREERCGHPYHEHKEKEGIADVPGGISDQVNEEEA